MKRKSTLEERQRQMLENQQKLRRQQDRRRKIDSERVMTLAAMGVSVREIARELGCSTDSLYVTHREAIEEGAGARGDYYHADTLGNGARRQSNGLALFLLEIQRRDYRPTPDKGPVRTAGPLITRS